MSGNEVADLPGVSLREWSQAVHLRVPLDSRQCVVARAVATVVALRGDLTVDAVADLEVLVDEMFAELAAVAAGGSLLRWFFADTDGGVRVHAYVVAATQQTWPRESTGRYLVAELADELWFWQSSERQLSECHVAATLHPTPV